jgi:hypothetical protein
MELEPKVVIKMITLAQAIHYLAFGLGAEAPLYAFVRLQEPENTLFFSTLLR